jgi:hypothetical protein
MNKNEVAGQQGQTVTRVKTGELGIIRGYATFKSASGADCVMVYWLTRKISQPINISAIKLVPSVKIG